ncbi:phosphoglycolate phosphatase [Lysinibacillus sp. YS11]|uniref:HAD family hydrolase n=1 Tax=Lysinibacillus TaxID=400634 RepID=UPI000654B2B2|nr:MULTISPECIES: HAD family hydrolase [Lysinibacillus]AUS85881.1 phosphoglycolate phosphatase [Lysinibacillus sp. YS11]KMN40855.1 5'-nucleotidase [Lysinibacillus sp. LK3]WNN77440.1 HAD family hydrolase [Lysinibacillus capsici]
MKNYSVVLFDLDGTLSDPKIGITKSVQHALQKAGVMVNDLDELEPFIGPPLQVSFQEIYGFNDTQITRAIRDYRERFTERGMFENKLYEDIPALLAHLKQQGYILTIATSKPTVFAEQIIKYFQLESYFDLVVGSHLDGSRSAKGEIIAEVLQQLDSYPKEQFIMIGDRKYDLIGARENQIDAIGVTYGFGSLEELKNEEPTYIVDHVNDLLKYL